MAQETKRKNKGVAILLLGLIVAGLIGVINFARSQSDGPIEQAMPAPAPPSDDVVTPTESASVEPVEPSVEPETVQVEITPEPVPDVEMDVVSVRQSEPEPVAAALDAPTFDLVRIEKDGTALIAGAAVGNGFVQLNLDGVPLGQTKTALTGTGQFVMFATLPPKPEAQVLRLQLHANDNDAPVLSSEKVFLTARKPQAAPAPALPPLADDTLAALDSPAPPSLPFDVEEPQAPTVILADDTGVRVLQSGGAGPPLAVVALDTISYDSAGEVKLGGRAVGEGFVRIYIDNAPVITSPVLEDGYWTSDLPEIDSGVYTLRIDEIANDGSVTSRVETPFKREEPARLAELMGIAAPTAQDAQPVLGEGATEVLEAATQDDTDQGNNGVALQDVVAPLAQTGQATNGAQISQTVAQAPSPDLPNDDTQAFVFTVKTVQPGATLWAIAQERYGDGTQFFKVFEANRDTIRNPDLIYPGQVFSVPD